MSDGSGRVASQVTSAAAFPSDPHRRVTGPAGLWECVEHGQL